jgi:hypothetical protein
VNLVQFGNGIGKAPIRTIFPERCFFQTNLCLKSVPFLESYTLKLPVFTCCPNIVFCHPKTKHSMYEIDWLEARKDYFLDLALCLE